MLSIAPSATAQGGDQRAGWYVSGGGGANWTSEIEQSGFNRDPLYYPTDACFDQDARPEFPGYRWAYDLESAGGAVARLPPGGTATSKIESDEPDAAIRVNTWQPAPYPLIIIECSLYAGDPRPNMKWLMHAAATGPTSITVVPDKRSITGRLRSAA